VTVLATFLALGSIVYTGVQARKSAKALVAERVRQQDLSTLKDVLVLNVGIETWSMYTSRKAQGAALVGIL